MTIEIALLVSVVSLAFAMYTGFSQLKRNAKKDTANDTSQLTTVIVKLENIDAKCSDIRTDISTIRNEIKDITERLVIVEQSTKSAHRRMDEHLGGKV